MFLPFLRTRRSGFFCSGVSCARSSRSWGVAVVSSAGAGLGSPWLFSSSMVFFVGFFCILRGRFLRDSLSAFGPDFKIAAKAPFHVPFRFGGGYFEYKKPRAKSLLRGTEIECRAKYRTETRFSCNSFLRRRAAREKSGRRRRVLRQCPHANGTGFEKFPLQRLQGVLFQRRGSR